MHDINMRIARELLRIARAVLADDAFADKLKGDGWKIGQYGIASKTVKKDFGSVRLSVNTKGQGNAGQEAQAPSVVITSIESMQRAINVGDLNDLVSTLQGANSKVQSCFNGK